MPHRSSQAPTVSGPGCYVESGAVAGVHRPQPSDLTSKKISPDGFSTCKQYDAPLSKSLCHIVGKLQWRKTQGQEKMRISLSYSIKTGDSDTRTLPHEPLKRAHSPQVLPVGSASAAQSVGLASVSENGKLAYGRRSLQIAAGTFNIC